MMVHIGTVLWPMKQWIREHVFMSGAINRYECTAINCESTSNSLAALLSWRIIGTTCWASRSNNTAPEHRIASEKDDAAHSYRRNIVVSQNITRLQIAIMKAGIMGCLPQLTAMPAAGASLLLFRSRRRFCLPTFRLYFEIITTSFKPEIHRSGNRQVMYVCVFGFFFFFLLLLAKRFHFWQKFWWNLACTVSHRTPAPTMPTLKVKQPLKQRF